MVRPLLAAVAAAVLVAAPAGASAAPPSLGNAVVNGSFERPVVPVGRTQPFPAIRGWRLAFGPDIEIQNHAAGDPARGRQFVELDSDASSGIYQRIPTRPNRLYRVQFFFSPRPGTSAAENVLVVKWHRRVVARLTGDGTGLVSADWHMYAIKVRATGRATRLEFDDGGISDSVGTLIDGVTVTRWRGHPTATR